jgi:predicted dehydrogenase
MIRAAIVGTGQRAQLYTEGLAARDGYRVVALCDPNPVRMAVHNAILARAGEPAATVWPPAGFPDLLREVRPDLVVVCSVDATHDAYIVPALAAGCGWSPRSR